jgi:hypothetical protein
MSDMIDCEDHGKQKAAEVCQHIVASRDDGQVRGFVADRDGGQLVAYCDACDAAIEKAGGEWTTAVEAQADMQLMCETCTGEVAAKNDVEMP